MEDQKKVWDKIAPSWDEYRKDVMDIIPEFFEKNKGRVLDLGCGSGRNILKIEGQELYAVDFSNEMIKIAKKNAKKKRVDVKFYVMEIDKLSFEDEFFDAILFWAVLHCIKGKRKRHDSLKEMYRVLKPGGRALVSSWGRGSPRLKNKPKECIMPWSVESLRQMRYTYIYDADELKRELEEIGFRVEKLMVGKSINVIVKKMF